LGYDVLPLCNRPKRSEATTSVNLMQFETKNAHNFITSQYYNIPAPTCVPGYRYRYSDSLRAGRYGDRIPAGGEIFRTRPDRPWDPSILLYNGSRLSFPGVKRPGRGVVHPPPFSAEVKERLQLYFYSPSGLSWPVLG